MKVLIKLKEDISIDNLNNRFFSKFKQPNDDFEEKAPYIKRVYKKNNIGICFLKDNYKLGSAWDDKTVYYWPDMLESIQSEGVLDEDLILNLFVAFASINLQDFLEEWRNDNDEEFELDSDLHWAVRSRFQEISGEEEFDWLLKKKCFFLMDDEKNIYTVLNGRLTIAVKSLYFTKKNGEIIISDDISALKEYLNPIYEINEGIYSFDTAIKPEELLETLSKSSNLVFEPNLKIAKERVRFHSPFLKKVNYDVSFDDFVKSLKFTKYANCVRIYETQKMMQEDSCSEFDCKDKHKENDELFIGASKEIRYISGSIYTGEIVMDGGLYFQYVKKVDTLIIETLPQINGVYVLNEAILNIILKILYNATDLENIKEVFISNKLLGPVVISKSVLEKLPKLQESRHYQKSLQIIEQLHQIYSDETQRRKALDLERKQERRIMITTINHNIDKFNEAFSIQKNAGIAPDSVFVKTAESGEDYVIIYHKSKTTQHKDHWHYRSTHIVEAPKVIDIEKDEIKLSGMVMCFPEGTTEIRGLRNKFGELTNKIMCQAFLARQGTLPNERQLFIILPSSLDLSKFEFFKYLDHKHLIFISDDITFVEQFRQLRREYNRTCESGKHFNAPIVCDPQIYEKIWGYRSNSLSLYTDLKDRIKLEQARVIEERRENEEYRFLQKREFAYVSEGDLTPKVMETLLEDMTDDELKETIMQGGIIKKLQSLQGDTYYGMYEGIIDIELETYSKRRIVEKVIQDLMLYDPEIVMAINNNDFSIFSSKTLEKRFNEFVYFVRNPDENFSKIIYDAFMGLVQTKIYFDIPTLPKRKYSDLGLVDRYHGGGYVYNCKDFYSIADFIISSELLVECLNYNTFKENIEDITKLINSSYMWDEGYAVLYIYQVLKESGLYFEVNHLLSHELIDELMKLYPPTKERFREIDKTLLGVPVFDDDDEEDEMDFSF